MTIELVCAALKTIADGLSPVTVSAGEAYELHGFNPPPPNAPDTAKLPGVWAYTGQATYSEGGGADWLTEERTYALQCAVMPIGQGTPEEREKRCRPILAALRAAIIRYSWLAVPYVQRVRLLGDSGIVVLPDFDGANIGFELRVGVTMTIPHGYAANE